MLNQQLFFPIFQGKSGKIQKSQKYKIGNYFSDISRQKRKNPKMTKMKNQQLFFSDISRQKRKISHLRIRMI
jgi:hypothetical protein